MNAYSISTKSIPNNNHSYFNNTHSYYSKVLESCMIIGAKTELGSLMERPEGAKPIN